MDSAENCPNCGLRVARRSAFCPDCGRPLAGDRSGGALLRRPGPVTFFSVLYFVTALVSLPGIPALILLAPDDKVGILLGIVGAFVVLVAAALHAVLGWGLWRLKGWARLVWIAEAGVGLVAFPFGTLISAFVLFYLFRPGVKLLFSDAREDDLTAEERWAVLQDRSSPVLLVMLAVSLAGSLMIGLLVAAIALPNLLNAVDRGKTKRTLADLQAIAAGVERYRSDHGAYPVASDIATLSGLLQPNYLNSVPLQDGWQGEFVAESDVDEFLLLSSGKDGIVESNPQGGITTDFDADIILIQDGFVQRPDLGARPR
ncbi:MAG: hypothetical protein GY716_22260 [bacterium]|nr:hypothetical protein [bacterium]